MREIKMDSIHEILDEIACSNARCVLATVIKVEGSAYRKEGASMLFMESGRQIGIISAGCLETDLSIQANKLLKEALVHSRTIVYDMSSEDDLSWGRGAGCNGKVHILLEYIHSKLRKQLCTVKEQLDQGNPVASLKLLKQNASTVRTIFVTKDQHVFGHENVVSKQCISMVLGEERPGIRYIDAFESNVYIHYFKPMPRLFIFGAGSDARPFSSIAVKTGFMVKIWDWRPAYCNQAYFPGAKCIQNTSLAETLKHIEIDATDSVVLMTHDFQKDKEILHSLLKYKQLSYLGVLGPRKRITRLLNGATIPNHLHSPVGLAIGAEGPEEIAISIIAELIQTQRHGTNEKGLSFEQKRNNRYLSSGGGK